MGQGLQIWDTTGKVLVDTTSQISTILGRVEAFAENSTYTFTNPKLNEGIPFFIVTPMSSIHINGFISVTFKGSTATITTGDNPRDGVNSWNFVVYIGVY